VKPGDRLLGLASSGLHSNGYSLARRIVFDVMGLGIDAAFPGTGRTVGQELLEPTRIYAAAVKSALEAGPVAAMAHVTGGGLPGNVPRVLPDGCRVVIRRGSWKVPAVFEAIRDSGRVEDGEMFRTFNMGIGYVIIVDREAAPRVTEALTRVGETVYGLGEVVAGARGVEFA